MPEFAELREACGIDPIGQVQTIIAAGKQGGGGEPDAVVVMKGLQRASLKTCGEKMAAKEGKKLTVTEEGNLANYVVDDKNIWAAWLDDSTVVIAPTCWLTISVIFLALSGVSKRRPASRARPSVSLSEPKIPLAPCIMAACGPIIAVSAAK